MTAAFPQPWFVPSGNETADVNRLVRLLCDELQNDTPDSDLFPQLGKLMKVATRNGVILAYRQGMPGYANLMQFAVACAHLTWAQDDSYTIEAYYQLEAIPNMCALHNPVKLVDAADFHPQVGQPGQTQLNLDAPDQVACIVDGAIWADGITAGIVVGCTGLGPDGKRYTAMMHCVADRPGPTVIDELRARFDGGEAPAFPALQQVQYFAVGANAAPRSLRKAFQLVVELNGRVFQAARLRLMVPIHQRNMIKGILVTAQGEVRCTAYKLPVQAWLDALPQIPEVPEATFYTSLGQTHATRAKTTNAIKPMIFTATNAALWADHTGPAVTVGLTAMSDQRNARFTVMLYSTGKLSGAEVIGGLQGLFNGVQLPAYGTLKDVGYFIVGGDASATAVDKIDEVLTELRVKGLNVAGIKLATEPGPAVVSTAVLVAIDGTLSVTSRRIDQFLQAVNRLPQIRRLPERDFRDVVAMTGMREIGANFNAAGEWDRPWVVMDDGLWTDTMSSCITVGFTARCLDDNHRYNALLHSFGDMPGWQIIDALQSKFDGAGKPHYARLTDVRYYVVGGAPVPESVAKAGSVLQEIALRQLTLMGVGLTLPAADAGLAKAVLIGTDGKVLFTAYRDQ
jgi:hypothetical protein